MNASKGLKIAAVLGFFLFSTGSLIFLELRHFAQTPYAFHGEVKVFTVISGEAFRAIAERLSQEKIIENSFKLRLYARATGDDRRIRTGEYALSASDPPSRILEIMASGRVVLHRVTIPEGFTLLQIAQLLEQSGLVDKEAFVKAATDPETARRLNIDAPTLEGYLFPETYHFPRPPSIASILSAMVGAFRKTLKPQWEKDAKRAGFSLHQIVTLASLIEKETGAAFERPLIASVFHNRLKKNMRLESDPTVIYGIEHFDGNLTRKHLAQLTPYNTYRISGLPPGPIANPGAGSLEAAVYPAKTRFLYFVSKNDGTHQFSEDIRAHASAVRQHQQKRGKTP